MQNSAMIPHGPVKCKSEINKMKAVMDGLEDQVKWENLAEDLQLKDQLCQQCDVYKNVEIKSFCFTTNKYLPVLEEWGLGFSEGPNKTFPWSSGNERQGEVD